MEMNKKLFLHYKYLEYQTNIINKNTLEERGGRKKEFSYLCISDHSIASIDW